MANFIPLKNYIFYCIEQVINNFHIKPPFLDVGCGVGDVSKYLGVRKWYGKAIDESTIAIEKASELLSDFPGVQVVKAFLLEENNAYQSIFLVDVLEHIQDDKGALEKVASLLKVGGHLILVVPSNQNEWRWDDEFYGHYRRYSADRIEQLLISVNLEPIVSWDVTYPVFWLMRRIYTQLKKRPKSMENSMSYKTEISSVNNAWEFPILSNLLSKNMCFWRLVYKLQFLYFKHHLQKGHEMLILARKNS